MTKIIFLIFGFIFLMGLSACEIKTPEIHGIVLDAETKQPVEGAWVRATAGIKSKTISGDVGSVIALHQPHTRTGKDGKFLIPSKSLKKPPFPISFGTELEDIVIASHTVDDKIGSITLKGEELKNFFKKDVVNVKLYQKFEQWKEEEYFSHLQILYDYCLTGRFGIEVPAVEGGCDEWELEYVITKHKRYLDKYKELSEKGEVKGYFAIIDQISQLYEKKGDIKKAIEALKKSAELMEKRGLLKFDVWQKNKASIEKKINELQKKLKEPKNEEGL
jgi:hypothetical protein